MPTSTNTSRQSLEPLSLEPSDMRNRILKLRWMGFEREAERLSVALSETSQFSSTTIGPLETD